jgi:multidrug efflux pump subunit AcrA (membrane-fusion protein)
MADSQAESGHAEAAKNGTPEMEGKVEFVGRIADPQTGNLQVLVLVENSAGKLAIGETLSVAIVIGERPGVLQVPSSAILDLGEGPTLTVVREGKSIVLHPELGKAGRGWMAISGTDLKEGEPVVTEGGYNLPEGTKVSTAKEEEKEDGEHKDKAGHKDEGEEKAKAEPEHEDKAEEKAKSESGREEKTDQKDAATPEHKG